MKSVLLLIITGLIIVLNIILVVAIIWNIYGVDLVVDENINGTSRSRRKCTTSECLTVSSTLLKSLNQTFDPCDNFYKFACAGFRASSFLPNDEEYVTNTFTTSALMEIKFNELLNEPIANDDPNYFKMMKKYYRACRNKVLIESEAEENALKIFKKLGGWPILEGENWNETAFDWFETLSRARKLGLPYDFYLKLELKYQKIQIRRAKGNDSNISHFYWYYLLKIAKLLGASTDDAEVIQQINDTYRFDVRIMDIATHVDINLQIQNTTLRQLENSSFPWFKYLDMLLSPEIEVTSDLPINYGLDDKSVNVSQRLEEILRDSPKRVQANALMWTIFQWMAPYLTEKIFLKQVTFNYLDGPATELKPRWKECVSSVAEQFKVGTTAIYTKKFLKNDVKPKITEIIRYINDNMKKQYLENLTKFEKLAPVLKKVEDTEFYVGFPDQILDESEVESYYDDLELVGDNYLNLAMDLNIFKEKRKSFSFSDRKFDWVEFVSIFDDHLELRPEILMTPVHLYNLMYFQKSIPEYINFGFLQKIIKPLYKVRRSVYPDWCHYYTDQYFPDSYVLDGTYLAYANFVQNRTDEILPGFENFTNSQMFFISHGASRCIKRRQKLLLVDEANEHFFNVAAKNSKYFSEIFNCPMGSKMKRTEPTHTECVDTRYPFNDN